MDVHLSAFKVDLVPSQAHQLGHSQCMPIAHQDQTAVSKAMSTNRARGSHERFNLIGQEILAAAHLPILWAGWNVPRFVSPAGLFSAPKSNYVCEGSLLTSNKRDVLRKVYGYPS